ncbi:MAG: hypothetical protein V4487_02965 [Chlamydiota bacterium]
MRLTIPPQQTAFFTQNGYIEFEGILENPNFIFESLRKAAAARLSLSVAKLAQKSPAELYLAGRDLWRLETTLANLFIRKLAPFAFALTAKQSLRLAADQWIPAHLSKEKATSLKDLFSIQGLSLGFLISSGSAGEPARSELGLLPLPSKPGSVLFFQPHLLLDWPRLIHLPPIDLYLGAYALPISVYVQNLKDPSTNFLKQFNYGFGDVLKNEFHPLIVQ